MCIEKFDRDGICLEGFYGSLVERCLASFGRCDNYFDVVLKDFVGVCELGLLYTGLESAIHNRE